MSILKISEFIQKYITTRNESFFKIDIEDNSHILKKEIEDKSLLVIGGAGTIGSSFIKSMLQYRPKKLVVVDINENGLTELTRDLRSEMGQFVPQVFLTYPMSFGSQVFVNMFKHHQGFDIVANFAAHKHVRSEKDIFSIQSMFENNLFQAKSFLDLLLQYKPKHFFCVSTDKATNPVNIMGASKSLMEQTIMAYKDDFKITTARFANVAFSNGSLLAGFIDRIFKQQPISCPNDVKRFFVSPEESGHICMFSCIIGNSGDIFFPKFNENHLINFKDIAINFINFINKKLIIADSEFSAKSLSKNINFEIELPVYFFKTDTSGEKLFEEFYSKDDEADLNKFNSFGVISRKKIYSKSSLDECLNSIKRVFKNQESTKKDIILVLKKYVNNFNHIETGINLDQKM